MKHTYLGIDMGTSAMKMVLIDSEKAVLRQVSEEYEAVHAGDGWSEIDPVIWYSAMKKGIHKIMEGQDTSALAGIGVTGQMHTLIVLGEDGKAVRPAMMWNDTRTKIILPELKNKIRKFPEGEYLSKTISTGSPAANLYWMKKYEPENLEKIKKFLIGPDYLVFCLTGNTVTDYCEASTSCLYRIDKKEWSEEIRQLIGLEKNTYPEIKGSARKAGKILPEIAEEFQFSSDVEVIVGTGDNPATAISTGCLGLGYPVISLGTSGIFMMPIEKPESQTRGKKILFSFDDKKYSFLVQGAVQCNGNTFDWWNRDIMEMRNFHKMTTELDVSKMAENELMFYPHLNGEKTIYADTELRGAFTGINLSTTQEDLFYAVIEGLCMGFRELAEKMKLPIREYGSVKVVGGGAKSPVWLQTMANVLNVSVEKMEGMIGPAFGIALLASYKNENFSSLQRIIEGNVITECCYQPDRKAASFCEKKYEKYLRMRKGLKYIENGSKVI